MHIQCTSFPYTVLNAVPARKQPCSPDPTQPALRSFSWPIVLVQTPSVSHTDEVFPASNGDSSYLVRSNHPLPPAVVMAMSRTVSPTPR